MKKIILLLLFIPLVFALERTSFDDGLTSFNLTANTTKTLILFPNATITNATMDMYAISTDHELCYQETATEATSCGGLGTGSYYANSGNFYINYTKPKGYSEDSKWQVKWSYNGSIPIFDNYTIPHDCFNAGTEKLQFYVITEGDVSYGRLYLNCYNGTSWKNISSMDGCNIAIPPYCSGSGLTWDIENNPPIYYNDGSFSTSNCYYPSINKWVGKCLNAYGLYATFYEEAMWWDIFRNITNPKVYMDDVLIFNRTGTWNSSAHIYLNTTAMNTYLANNITIPVYFMADNFMQQLTVENITVNYTGTLTFNVYDEMNYERINGISYLELFSDTGSYNYTLTTGNISITMPNDYFELRFWTTNYLKRQYFINMTTPTSSQNIDLILLNTTESNHAVKVFTVVDESNNPVPNCTVKMKRKYVDCNCYRIVEMTKTDDLGNGFLYTSLYDGVYIFDIEYQNMVKKTTGEIKLDSRDLVFKINLLTNEMTSFYDVTTKVTGGLSYNTASNIWNYNYDDGGIGVTSSELVVTKQGTYSTTNICDNIITGSTGSSSCNISGYENDTVLANAYVTTSDGAQHLISSDSHSNSSSVSIFGGMGLFLSIFILMIFGLVGIWNPAAGIVMELIGLVICVASKLLFVETTVLAGIIIAGLIVAHGVKT